MVTCCHFVVDEILTAVSARLLVFYVFIRDAWYLLC
jgi:hypothetical protein